MSSSPEPRARTGRPSLIRLGGLPFLVTALFGRLPAAMIQLGLLLYLTSAGAGLVQAGQAVAMLGIGTAVGGPLVGALIDRVAPAWVVGAATLVQSAGLVGLATVTEPAAQLALAALLGAANPQVGSIARGHWARLARDRQDPTIVPAAMGWEGAADEISFVAGPAVAGVLIGGLGPARGLLAVLALTVVGQLAFVAHLAIARVRPVPRDVGSAPAPALRWRGLVGPLLVAYAMGVTFGVTQTGLTAHFGALGRAGLTGPVYALLGVGSALGSLGVARLVWPRGSAPRVLLSGIGLAASAAGLVVAGGLGAVATATFALGLFIGPAMVTAYAWGESAAPRERLTTAMTVLSTAVVLGVSTGALVGARTVTAYGVVPERWLAVGAGLLVVVVGAVGSATRTRTFRHGDPGHKA